MRTCAPQPWSGTRRRLTSCRGAHLAHWFGATIRRYEDNNATIAAFVSGQVDLIATGNTVAAVIAEKSASRAPSLKFVVKDSPCFIGLNKDEPALLAKVNEIVAKAKASGELGKMSEKWLKAPLPPGF